MHQQHFEISHDFCNNMVVNQLKYMDEQKNSLIFFKVVGPNFTWGIFLKLSYICPSVSFCTISWWMYFSIFLLFIRLTDNHLLSNGLLLKASLSLSMDNLFLHWIMLHCHTRTSKQDQCIIGDT